MKTSDRIIKSLFLKFKEAVFSVMPVTAIFFAFALTPFSDFSASEFVTFGVSWLFLIIGITLFIPKHRHYLTQKHYAQNIVL